MTALSNDRETQIKPFHLFRMLQYFWQRMTPCCSLGPCYLFIPFLIFLYNNYLHVYIDPLIKPVWDLIDPYIGHYIRNEDPATGVFSLIYRFEKTGKLFEKLKNPWKSAASKSGGCCGGKTGCADDESSDDEDVAPNVTKRRVKKAD